MARLKLKVLSQEGLEQLASVPFEAGTFVVSIADTDAPPVQLANAPAGILLLSFDDVYPATDGEDDEGAAFSRPLQPMSEEQAERIARFLVLNRPHMRMLVCQCRFGQSRSAGVAAAAAEWISGDGAFIFGDARFLSNRHVYRLVLDALRRIDAEED